MCVCMSAACRVPKHSFTNDLILMLSRRWADRGEGSKLGNVLLLRIPRKIEMQGYHGWTRVCARVCMCVDKNFVTNATRRRWIKKRAE